MHIVKYARKFPLDFKVKSRVSWDYNFIRDVTHWCSNVSASLQLIAVPAQQWCSTSLASSYTASFKQGCRFPYHNHQWVALDPKTCMACHDPAKDKMPCSNGDHRANIHVFTDCLIKCAFRQRIKKFSADRASDHTWESNANLIERAAYKDIFDILNIYESKIAAQRLWHPNSSNIFKGSDQNLWLQVIRKAS